MTSREFCFWLQGFFELDDKGVKRSDYVLTHQQMHAIRQHLSLVFKHEIDPSMGDKKHQDELNEIHEKPECQGGTIPNHLLGYKDDGTKYGPDELRPRC